MSDMELFYGTYTVSTHDVPDDYDDREELEEKLSCIFVKIDDVWYEAHQIEELDAFGFSVVIPPSTDARIMCYWYNGGGDVTEVLGATIKRHLTEGDD